MRPLAIALAVIVALLLLAGGAAAWMLNTSSGTRWALARAQGVLAPKLSIAGTEGSLAGPLTLTDVSYRDPAAGIEVAIARLTIDLRLAALWNRVVHIEEAALDGVRIARSVPTAPAEPKPAAEPLNLEPPIDIVVDAFTLTDLSVGRVEPESGDALVVTRAELAGSWTREGLAVRRLDVRSPQGFVQFEASLTETEPYVGQGAGRFQWQVAESRYEGRVALDATEELATLSLDLASPVTADLTATLAPLGRTASEGLEGTVRGRVVIADRALHIDPLEFALADEVLVLETLRLRIDEDAGALLASGRVQLAADPVSADVQVEWSDLRLPAQWMGQDLRTRGNAKLTGSAAAFSASGAARVDAGDLGSDIALRVSGSTSRIDLERFAIVQDPGMLEARGTVDITPQLGWRIDATADRFDPGRLLAGWPGELAFALQTDGTIADAGPTANLTLTDLRGTLRARPISGRADLRLTAARSLSGTADLRSGDSTVTVRAASGDIVDAVAEFSIASLDDWVPDTSGRIDGLVRAAGRWPDLTIDAEADGSDLSVAGASVRALRLRADVQNPQSPSGSVTLTASDLAAGGLDFARLVVNASGDEAAHTIDLGAEGEPLDTRLTLRGSRTPQGWAGTIEQLALDVTNVASLSSEAPSRLVFEAGNVSLGDLCLADAPMRLCLGGEQGADASLSARYSLANVPLALATVLAPDAGLRIDGTVDGEGAIARTPLGEWTGSANVTSPFARLAEVTADGPPLTLYENLEGRATLAGERAEGTLRAQLSDGGSLSGNLSAIGLGQVSTELDGRVEATIPTLAPFAPFAPQLTDLGGRVALDVTIDGTLQAPQLRGGLTASELTAQIPQVGITVREGALGVSPAPDGAFAIDGSFRSGEGRVTVDGTLDAQRAVDVAVTGEQFLAANIPGARVVISPDLRFTRTTQLMRLTGEVTIPNATIDLQKLPLAGAGGGPRVSSDVVVVDEELTDDSAMDVPLQVSVTVILGERVELAGFGLDATVGGRLVVNESPGRPTTGSGDINVAGTYKAFGQDLTITQGRLLYASTPLDNPGLNIEAIREIDQEITAGLRVRGSARAPELTVFSNPPMSQSDALAYLTTGRPLSAVGSEDGDLVQSAAQSLGTAGGRLLARNLGSRLGLDTVSVEDDELIGGAAFTVGQYLSPRLYLSYGVGLFDPGEVVTLRYKVSRQLSIEAQRGSEETRAGVEYRIER